MGKIICIDEKLKIYSIAHTKVHISIVWACMCVCVCMHNAADLLDDANIFCIWNPVEALTWCMCILKNMFLPAYIPILRAVRHHITFKLISNIV